MEKIKARTVKHNDQYWAEFRLRGNTYFFEILNPEGLKYGDQIEIHWNGRDDFVRLAI